MVTVIERAVPMTTLAAIRAAIASEDRGGALLEPAAPESRRAASALLSILRAHPTFESATYAGIMTLPIFCRYGVGPGSPMHVDPPLLGGFPKLRADLAVSVNLGDGATYEGGELIVDDGGVVRSWKGEAGDCIVCPAGAPRSVAPVREGSAWMALFWVQSLIPDSSQRQILFDLTQALEELEQTSFAARHLEALRRSCTNLTRLWAEVPGLAAPAADTITSKGGAG